MSGSEEVVGVPVVSDTEGDGEDDDEGAIFSSTRSFRICPFPSPLSCRSRARKEGFLRELGAGGVTSHQGNKGFLMGGKEKDEGKGVCVCEKE